MLRRPRGDDYTGSRSCTITITRKSKSKTEIKSKNKKLQHLVPFTLVLEHDFAEEANGWHAVVEQLVVELWQ